MTTKVTERKIAQQAPAKIDREAGVIYDVKVCGNRSKNGLEYSTPVLEAAVAVYEGVPVYLDHGELPGDERPLDAHFGSLKNVRVKEGELYADLHYVRNHPAAEAVLERAERFANNFGMSHDAEIESVMESGVQKVTKILEVASVDLVTRPATNKGIFEHTEPKPMKKMTVKQVYESLPIKTYPGKYRVLEMMATTEDPMMEVPVEVEEMEDGGVDADAAIASALEQALVAICQDSQLDRKTKLKKLGEVLKQQEKLTSTEAPAEPASEMEEDPEDEVVEAEGEDDDKAKEMYKEKTAESVKLKRRIAELERQVSKADTVAKVLESQDIKNAPAALKATLSQFDTEAEMVEYLDGGPAPSSVLESKQYPIPSAVMESEGEAAKDKEEFLSRCFS